MAYIDSDYLKEAKRLADDGKIDVQTVDGKVFYAKCQKCTVIGADMEYLRDEIARNAYPNLTSYGRSMLRKLEYALTTQEIEGWWHSNCHSLLYDVLDNGGCVQLTRVTKQHTVVAKVSVVYFSQEGTQRGDEVLLSVQITCDCKHVPTIYIDESGYPETWDGDLEYYVMSACGLLR